MSNKSKWSTEEITTLIKLYSEGKSFVEIRDADKLMEARYKASAMSLRDKIFGLQKERIRNKEEMGDLSRPLASDKYDYRIYAKTVNEGKISTRKRKDSSAANVAKKVKKDISTPANVAKLSENQKKVKIPPSRITTSWKDLNISKTKVSYTVQALDLGLLTNDLSKFTKDLASNTISYNDKVGLLLSQTKKIEIDEKFCFKNIHQCKCSIPCTIRRHHNTWLSKVDWHPIEEADAFNGKPYIYNKKMIFRDGYDTVKDYDSAEFYKQVILRDRSKKLVVLEKYSKTLVKMRNDGILHFLRCPEFMMKQLEQFELHTLKMKLFVIKLFMDSLTYLEKYTVIGPEFGISQEKIQKLYVFVCSLVDAHYLSQVKTETEIDKWIEWGELVKLVPKVYVELSDQEYLGYLLMVEQQTMRNDYATLKFILPHQQSVEFDILEENYVDLGKNIFFWNYYKTVKTHGPQSIQIKNDKIRMELMKMATRKHSENKDYLFAAVDGTQMSRISFGIMLNNITEKYTGKRIGSQMMRKIFTSDFRKDDLSNEQSKKLADSLMHTTATSSGIYRKL